MLLAALLLLISARKPQHDGDLLLDMDRPVVDVTIGGVPMRLRVDMSRYDAVELNPEAATKLSAQWESGPSTQIGRVELKSGTARFTVEVAGRSLPLQAVDYGRACCADADGAIGPDLLPFATVTWVRRQGADLTTETVTLPLQASDEIGLSVPSGDDNGIRVRFAFDQPITTGTASAGAILAQRWRGLWGGDATRMPLRFGVERPVRRMLFGQTGKLASFPVRELMVRTADYATEGKLPPDAVEADEVQITHPLGRQRFVPVVTIGEDRLSHCAQITYLAVPRSLILWCAFDLP